MHPDRRRFLEVIGGSSLLATVGAARADALTAESPSRPNAADADPARHPAARTETWDVRWADRIQGRYRAVFDSPEVAEGAALLRAILWSDQYAEVYGSPRSEFSPVLVLRHNGIDLAMNDEFWKAYKVGKSAKIKLDGKWAERNPIAMPTPGTPPQWAKYNLTDFQREGGIVLACNLAFQDIIGRVAKADKLDHAAAEARARTMLVPGVILQPSGVFAVLRAQEAGCKYMFAS